MSIDSPQPVQLLLEFNFVAQRRKITRMQQNVLQWVAEISRGKSDS